MMPVTGSPVRRLVLPLLAVGLVVVALPRGSMTDVTGPASAPGPATPAPLVEDPFSGALSVEQTQLLLELWDAWAPDLASTSGAQPARLPAEMAALGFEEAAYVLISVRAAQVAAAVADAESAEEDVAVLARSGLTTEPPTIVIDRVADGGCLSVRWRDDPNVRTFYGLVADSDEPGPEPLSALEGVLLRTVRVGLDDVDRATCGAGGVAFSPAAQRALATLTPELLAH
jgi:hypothetical protein